MARQQLATTSHRGSDPKNESNGKSDAVGIHSSKNRILALLDSIFGLDTRSIALFRILLGLGLIADLLYRARDNGIMAHYTDAGILPRSMLAIWQGSSYDLTIHAMSGAYEVQCALFVIAGIIAFSLMLGYRCRTCAVLSWVMLVSLQNRNFLILTGEDGVLRMCIFWAMFMPLGLHWSVDKALSKTDEPLPKHVLSPGTAGMVIQVAVVYLFGALFKTGPMWRTNNTAIWYALSVDQFATPLAKALLAYPHLLQIMTWFTWRLEFLAAFLILTSAWSPQLRTLLVFVFIGFHFSIGACLELGLFAQHCTTMWIILLPAWFWETLGAAIGRMATKLTSGRRRNPEGKVRLAIRRLIPHLNPDPLGARGSTIGQTVAALFLIYIVLWNLRGYLGDKYNWLLPPQLDRIAEVTRVDQKWQLFAPEPTTEHGFLVVAAHTKDDSTVDLLQEVSPATFAPPPRIVDSFINDRWRKYMLNLCLPENQAYRYFYCQFMYNKFRSVYTGERRIDRITLYYIMRPALPNYKLGEWKQYDLFDFAPRD